MTKRRQPATFEDALVQIAALVPGGFDTMGVTLDLSAGMVRAWSDPERREKLPADAIVSLDLLYAEHGGEGSPLFESLDLQLDVARAGRFAHERELAVGAMKMSTESGDAIAAVIKASLPGATDDDRRQARKEVAELNSEVARVFAQLTPGQEAPT